jgi:predicted nucleic acid-binding protein
MNRKYRIYLDTSVWNFVFAEDSPPLRDITLDFFDNSGDFELYISRVVLAEIEQAPEMVRAKLEELIRKYKPVILEMNEETERMAAIYVNEDIIPEKKWDDAEHIAISTVYEMDILLSWNYKRLANIRKKREIQFNNLREGYDKPLELLTPMEVAYEDKE